METKLLFVVAIVCFLGMGCHNKRTGGITDKCGACPLYGLAEILPVIEVKIVDKVSGADLFLAPGSPYKPTDLLVNGSVDGPNIHFVVDTGEANNRFVWVPAAISQTYTLKLANLSSDSINVIAARDSPICCPRLRIKSITLDNTLVCSPCTLRQLVTIKK